jgi:hypothetical protein
MSARGPIRANSVMGSRADDGQGRAVRELAAAARELTQVARRLERALGPLTVFLTELDELRALAGGGPGQPATPAGGGQPGTADGPPTAGRPGPDSPTGAAHPRTAEDDTHPVGGRAQEATTATRDGPEPTAGEPVSVATWAHRHGFHLAAVRRYLVTRHPGRFGRDSERMLRNDANLADLNPTDAAEAVELLEAAPLVAWAHQRSLEVAVVGEYLNRHHPKLFQGGGAWPLRNCGDVLLLGEAGVAAALERLEAHFPEPATTSEGGPP